MATERPITYDGIGVGSIEFETPNQIDARRLGADRLSILFPIIMHLEMRGDPTKEARYPPQPLLSNLSASVWYQDQFLGYARHRGFFTGGSPRSNQPGHLVWNESRATLAFYEELRGERPPSIRFDVSGELCYVKDVLGVRVQTEPKPMTANVEVTYSRDAWVAMLRLLKVADIVIVEVPLPEDAPPGWATVWEALRRAREAFEQGGRHGWTTCVLSVRHALEAWEALGEPEATWPDDRKQREALSKQERLKRLRWSLHQAAHPVAHADQPQGFEEWTREEARFVLSQLCGLLRMRHRD